MARAFWASIFVLWFFWSPSQAQTEGEKKRAIEYAPLGALITDVGDFDRQAKRFDATFWLWTLTANPEDNPIADLSFPNAIEIKESLIHQEKTLQGFWITRKVRGTFRHAWNMSDFPFDGQTLAIQLVVNGRDYARLRFIDDGVTSIVDSNLKIPGWDIEGASLYAGKTTYRSSFGDPRIEKDSEVTYAAADVSITLKRANYAAFWKLTIAAFVAAGLAIPAFFVRLDAQSRLGLLTASVFADVLSMQSASSDLGAVEYVTLVDKIHIMVLVYTFIATVFVLYTHAHHTHHESLRTLKWNGYRVGLMSTFSLVLAIAVLVWSVWSR
jgi:hypothetical protein